jgi:tRNA1(Val) A37 N6-methylase TrmN6
MTAAGEASSATTDDVFLAGHPDGGVRVLQPKDGLRAGLDAIMLAASIPARSGEAVLDAGAGVGVVGLAVARRRAGVRVTLVERETGLVELARLNIARNAFANDVNATCADLLQPLASLAVHGLLPGSFDHVVANPPYYDADRVRASPRGLKAGASAFGAGDLDRWLRFLAAMAKPDGRLSLVHRAEALADIMDAIGARFGAVTIFPLFARAGQPASRIVVQGVKGSRAPLRLLSGLVLHTDAGGFTAEADAILRSGGALSIGPQAQHAP